MAPAVGFIRQEGVYSYDLSHGASTRKTASIATRRFSSPANHVTSAGARLVEAIDHTWFRERDVAIAPKLLIFRLQRQNKKWSTYRFRAKR